MHFKKKMPVHASYLVTANYAAPRHILIARSLLIISPASLHNICSCLLPRCVTEFNPSTQQCFCCLGTMCRSRHIHLPNRRVLHSNLNCIQLQPPVSCATQNLQLIFNPITYMLNIHRTNHLHFPAGLRPCLSSEAFA